METTVIVLIVVIVLLVVALAAAGLMVSRRRRSEQLQDHYGPEYERTLAETGDRRAAEARLAEREKRHNQLDIRELDPQERDRYTASWTTIQQDFVDDPVRSVHAADELVNDIMRTRGYPVDDDFERRAEDVSVEHPQVVARYREAREIRLAGESGMADTEQQRHAITSYRALIDALLGSGSATGDDVHTSTTQSDGAARNDGDTHIDDDTRTNGHPARTTTTEEHTR